MRDTILISQRRCYNKTLLFKAIRLHLRIPYQRHKFIVTRLFASTCLQNQRRFLLAFPITNFVYNTLEEQVLIAPHYFHE